LEEIVVVVVDACVEVIEEVIVVVVVVEVDVGVVVDVVDVVVVDEVVGAVVEVVISVVVVSSGFSVMQPHNKDNVAINRKYFSVFIFNRLFYSSLLRRLLLSPRIFPLSLFCVVCSVLGL